MQLILKSKIFGEIHLKSKVFSFFILHLYVSANNIILVPVHCITVTAELIKNKTD